MAHDTIRISCATPTCPNYQVLHRDGPLPSGDWFCSTCEDHHAELEADDLYRREQQAHNHQQEMSHEKF